MASYEKALNEFDTFNPVKNLWRNVLIVAISEIGRASCRERV